MYVIDDINTPEYYIDGVIFTSYADVCAFVERFEIVRPYLNMPEYFCGFTINGKFFFNNIGEIESLVKQIAPITHPFWTDLLGDLDELSFIIKENTKSYHVAASHDETIEDSMYGTYCISCNTSTTMKPRSVMIFENNYIVLCESCADNQLIIRKCD
jgi:hypothetical protein